MKIWSFMIINLNIQLKNVLPIKKNKAWISNSSKNNFIKLNIRTKIQMKTQLKISKYQVIKE